MRKVARSRSPRAARDFRLCVHPRDHRCADHPDPNGLAQTPGFLSSSQGIRRLTPAAVVEKHRAQTLRVGRSFERQLDDTV
jgi:hypothetical protein